MTEKQKELVHELRLHMLRTGYQPVYAVTLETLMAVTESIEEDLLSKGLDPIVRCGEYGLWFKNCELVLAVSDDNPFQP